MTAVIRVALLLLVAWTQPLPGEDSLALLPGRWSAQLQVLPAVDLGALKPSERDAIVALRRRIADALTAAEPSLDTLAADYGELGARYRMHMATAAAAIALANAAALEPEAFQWAYYEALVAQETGRLATALEGYERARGLGPPYPALNLRAGQVLTELGRLDAAEERLRSAAAHPGTKGSAEYHLAQLALLRRDFQSAISHLQTVLRIDPGASAAHYPLSQALAGAGRRGEAREQLALAGDREPDFADPLFDALEAFRQPAEQQFRIAMKAVNDYDYAQAAESFAAGLAIDADNSDARVSYARVLYLAGDAAAARGELAATLQREPDHPLALLLSGLLAEADGDLATALRDYQGVVSSDPDDAGGRYFLGRALIVADRDDEAIAPLRAAVELEPANLPAYFLLYGALQRTHTAPADRRRLLETALNRSGRDPRIAYLLAWELLAAEVPGTAQHSRGLALATRLAADQPMPPNIELLAWATAASGDFEEAQALQAQALDMAALFAKPDQVEVMRERQSEYAAGRLPAAGSDPTLTAALTAPPPLRPVSVFRDYPAAQPY